MSLEVEATYQDGILKLDQPLPLRDQERVKVSVTARCGDPDDRYGCVRAPNDLEALEYLAHHRDNASWEHK